MLRALIPLLVLGVAVYAAVDCIQTDDDRVRGLPKLVWVLLIVIAPIIGPAAWFFAGRPPRPTSGPSGPRRLGPRGPDDDPDFLRKL